MEDPCESIPERLHHVEGTHTGGVCKEQGSRGRTHAGEVHGGLRPVKSFSRSEQKNSR